MVKCCSPARAKMKRAATRKATVAANKAVKSGKGVKPKKASPKKAHAKKAHAKKATPCRLCGKGK
jgi:hypothetical protein